MAITNGVPLSISASGAKMPVSHGRSPGSAIINAARAGEMMPESDQVVCIMPFARGSSVVRNQHRVGGIKRRVMEGAGRCRQPIDGVRHDHDRFAIVAVCPGAGERPSEDERNREPEIEHREGDRKLRLLLRRGVEHLRKIDVEAQIPSCHCRSPTATGPPRR